MDKKMIATILVVLFSMGAIYAQTTGRMAGRVTDQDGEPVAFASVVLVGTDPVLGTQTREDGTYILNYIPVGSYDVQAQQIGFRPTTVTGVRINVNETATVNIRMADRDAVEIGEYVTRAEREMVQADRTGSRRQVGQDTIENIAVDGVDDIIALQAGTTMVDGNLHIRGGRANEVVYTIDGMSVSDPVDGGTAMTVDRNAIADMVVMTGGFTAEFGNAQSGIVNIVTRDGTSQYSGSVEMISDHLITDGTNRDELKFTLGGPVLGPAFPHLRSRFTFFFNAAAMRHDSRFKDYFVSNPFEDFQNLVGREEDYPVRDPFADRDQFLGFDLDERHFNSYNANLRFTYRHSPQQTFSFSTRADVSKNIPFLERPYGHIGGNWSWRYALEHYAEVEEDMRQHMFTYNHMFNPQTNLNVRGSYFRKTVNEGPRGISRHDFYQLREDWIYDPDDYETGFEGIDLLVSPETGLIRRQYQDPEIYIDPENWQYRMDGRERARTIPGFVRPGSFWSRFIDDETTTMTLRGDLEYQLDMANNVKTGFEITRHEIIKDRWLGPQGMNMERFERYLRQHGTIEDIIPAVYDPDDSTVVVRDEIIVYDQKSRHEALYETSGTRDGYEAVPYQGAFYLQDRLEFEGMIANVGLRFDFWYLGEDYIRIYDGVRERVSWDEWDVGDDVETMRLMVSPRVGVSHPISERAVLHFAYNYQNQLPQMQYIFTTTTKDDAILFGGTVGNPNLEPQITVTYEVGLQQQLGQDHVLDVTAYYKNIYNYVSIMTMEEDHPDHGEVTYLQYISEDYGSTRGIDFTLQRMLSNFIAGSLTYSLAWAQGNHSGLTVKDEATGNLREFPLNWDQRHAADLNAEFRVGRDEEWYLPFTDILFPMDDFSLNFVYSIASGRPYTPIAEEGNERLDTNSRRRPTTETASLRFTKNFRFGRNNNIRFWVNVRNLFNKRNILRVFPRTGRHDWDGADISENHPPDYVDPVVEYNYLRAIQDPSMVGGPRTITTGLSFAF